MKVDSMHYGKNDNGKAVVVFAGARDNYQLALAMQDADLLDGFVTNVYSRKLAMERYGVELRGDLIHIPIAALGLFALMRAVRQLDLHYYSNQILSARARELAELKGAALFACSYYAYRDFRPDPGQLPYRFIIQIHTHPRSVRTLLLEELDRVPAARQSLTKEAEIRMSTRQFEELAVEPQLANGWVVASSYTARTLADNGIPLNKIHVVPYGLDFATYPERTTAPASNGPFTIMFLGSILQRKGLSYLLDAVRLLHTAGIRMRLRGRGDVDEGLLAQYRDLDLDIQLNLPTAAIVREMQQSDVFVLPSIAEGFAHVILQAMGCGLPVITTENTCGPDVILNEQNGFIVPVRDPAAIAEKIEWSITHREALGSMGRAAAKQARLFTWARFREGIRGAYANMLEDACKQ